MSSIHPLPAVRRSRWARPLLLAALAGTLMPLTAVRADTPAPESTEARLRRIEGELRAVQRKVFPDGAGKTFAPEITPGETTPPPAPTGNTGAIADLLARMDAVEAQLKALTASGEDSQDRIAKLDARIGAVESAQAAAAAAATNPPPPASQPPAAEPQVAPVPEPAKPARTPAKAAPKPAEPAPVTGDAAARAAAVAAIVKPSSDDKGEDTYTYGYRLWEAKFLPEAQAVLVDFADHYPKHKRISYARNLLGRAYLDDNRLRSAEQVFLQNYLADKTADRAPDSLLYLAIALTRDKLAKRACDALAQFRQDYPAEAEGRLKGQFDAETKLQPCS
jgi:TolA-binding protein